MLTTGVVEVERHTRELGTALFDASDLFWVLGSIVPRIVGGCPLQYVLWSQNLRNGLCIAPPPHEPA